MPLAVGIGVSIPTHRGGGTFTPGSLRKATMNLGQGEMVPANFINVFHALTAQVLSSDQTDFGRLDNDGYPVSTLTVGILMGPITSSGEAWAGQYKLAWPAGRSNWKLSFGAGGCTINSTSGSPTTSGGSGGNMTVQPSAGVAGYVIFTATAAAFGSISWPSGAFYAAGSGEVACYRVSDEAAYLAGEYFSPEFIARLVDLSPRALRPMGWTNSGAGNLNSETNWSQRMPVSHRSWGSYYPKSIWGGAIAGTNTYTGSAATDTPGSWTDGEQWTGIIANANTTTTPTLNISARGAKTIISGISGAALANGDLAANTVYTFTYDAILDKLLVYAGGIAAAVPWEAQIQLCNRVSANWWGTIPFNANNTYVTQLATLTLANLSASLLWEPEYSNEVWNEQFPQTKLARLRGTAFGWGDSSNQNVYGWYGLKTRQFMGTLIPAVYVGKMNRLRRKLAYQGAGDTSSIANRFGGSQLKTANANAAFSTYTSNADYTTKPNRPVDVVEDIAYAPYAGGTLLRYGADNDLAHTPIVANEAAQTQAIVTAWDAGDTATAIALVDADVRQGRTGVQTVTGSGTTFTTPLAHNYVAGDMVWFSVAGGTIYSGVTAFKPYSIASTPTSTTFTMKAFSGNNETGSAINAGSAGSGTMSVGTSATTLLTVSKMRLFSEICAATYDGDRPTGMSNLGAAEYEGALEPKEPSAGQCTTLGLTGADPNASLVAAIEAWRNDSASMFTQYDYFRTSLGTYSSDPNTFGLMTHAIAPAHLVLSGAGLYGFLATFYPNSTARRLYDGFKAFSLGSAPATAAPAAYVVGQWTVADLATGGNVRVTLTTLPDKNGSAITAINYRVNGGSWVSSGRSTAGTFDISGLTNGASATIELQAVNSVGSSAASDTKSVTATAAPANSKTYAGSIGNEDGSQQVIGSLDIGTASADRRIVVIVEVSAQGTTDPTVTVNGTTLTKRVGGPGTGRYGALYDGLVTTGNGSQVISVTGGDQGGYQFYTATAWVLKGVSYVAGSMSENNQPFTAITVVAGEYLIAARLSSATLDFETSPTQAVDQHAFGAAGGTFTISEADWTIASSSAAFNLGLRDQGGSPPTVYGRYS